jgi:NADPH2:quinone reductase
MKAIRVHAVGGPEVLIFEDAPAPAPGPKEALVRLSASGVNFIDIYHRIGLYPLPLPFIPGNEGAGVVEAVGGEVTDVRPGDRVAFAMTTGAYAELAVVPAWRLVPIPKSVDFEAAAASMLQGMTAHYLAHSTFPLKPGHQALVHAAAGGVGLLLVQMAKKCGARVLGTVSTEAKAEAARRAGADVIIRYTEEDFEAAVKRETDGRGLDVVYDSVGVTTFDKSLRCLKPRGMLVLFGQSSGPVPPVDPGELAKRGSLFLTRPTLAHYTLDRAETLERAGDVLSWMESGELDVAIERVLPLKDAAEAHRLLEARRTSGKLVLKV